MAVLLRGRVACVVVVSWVGWARGTVGYVQTNLVSTDASIPAAFHDPNLVNPWGIAFSGGSPFWTANNGTGTSTLYNSAGAPQALVVTVPNAPGATGPSHPTGVVANPSTVDFPVSTGVRAVFVFATEDGEIAGWNASSGTTAVRVVDNSAFGAVYKGLAIGNNGSANFLYAANFKQGRVDTFDAAWSPTLAGGFVVPTLPAGQSPFNVQNIGGTIYVSYAVVNPTTGDDVPGAGNGRVVAFDGNGNLVRTVTAGGVLNSPWGMALAPATFGDFAGDLLVGNFGDGRINAFDPATGTFVGTLSDAGGQPIVIPGLWGLTFGNNGNGGRVDTLYFTAGPAGETKGVLGSLAVAPEPGWAWLVVVGVIGVGAGRRRRVVGV